MKDVSEEKQEKRKEQLISELTQKQQGFKTVFLYNVP
jgi:hypothetical protein